MKKRMTMSLAVALAVIMALGCAAFAATQLDGIAGAFGFVDQATGKTIVNEAVLKHIEALNEVYEGETVRFTLNEGMYSLETGYVSMGWTLEPLTKGEQYYILCNEKVGGRRLEAGMLRNMTEFILQSPVSCVRTGYLTGEGLETELSFSILKFKGEPVRVYHGDDETDDEFFTRCEALIAEGKLPVADDGVIEVRRIKDKTYGEELVIAGAAELAEEFTVSFDLSQISPIDEKRTYEGEKTFTFDGFEIQLGEVIVTPTDSRICFDYISDTEITQEDIENGNSSVNIEVPGMESWKQAAHTRCADPVKTEDGRWKISVTYEATQQIVYPEELIFSIFRYDGNGNPIPLTGKGIPLKLTDAAEK